jgi:hypothetical protein
MADIETTRTLLEALFQHVGAGHTVWFVRELLSHEQVLVALRALLLDGAPITHLGAFLREVLVGLDLQAPGVGFPSALSSARARWRWLRRMSQGAIGTPQYFTLSRDLEHALSTASTGWDATLPATGSAVDQLRQSLQVERTETSSLLVAPSLREYVAAALYGTPHDLTVLGHDDIPPRVEKAAVTALGVRWPSRES